MVKSYKMETRVTSFEVGPERRLKYSMVLKLLQEAAGRQLEESGLSYETMRAKGFVFLLVKAAFSIGSLPAYGETVETRTWFFGLSGAQFIRNVRFSCKGRAFAQGETRWVLVGPETHRILRPSVFPFDGVMEPVGENVDIHIRKIPPFPKRGEGVETGERPVRWSDIDCNGHMNNAVYADLICDFFPGGLYKREIDRFQIDFIGEAAGGDVIRIGTVCEDGTVYYSGMSGERRCFCAAAHARPFSIII